MHNDEGGLALRGANNNNNNKHSLCKSGFGWDGRPAGGQVHTTAGTGAAVAVTAPCRAAVFTHVSTRQVAARAGRGDTRRFFPSDWCREFSLSLSLSLVFMDGGEEERERRRSGFSFFFFPHDSGVELRQHAGSAAAAAAVVVVVVASHGG